MPYPDSQPNWYTPFTTPITLQAMQHTTRHKNMEADIVELAKKLGIGASLPASGKFLKSATDGASSWESVSISDVAGTVPVTKGGTDATSVSTARTNLSIYSKAEIDALIVLTVAAAKQESYPVGSMYFNAENPENPAVLLGFGVWEAYAQGRVPVGKAATGTFAVAGATPGAETHTLTAAQMPSHSHAYKLNLTHSDGEVVTAEYVNAGLGYGTVRRRYSDGTELAGGGAAHNNIQPSIVVFIWRRTA